MNIRTHAREVFGDRATVSNRRIVVTMTEQEYSTELARLLFALDDGRDWCGEFKDGVAVFEPLQSVGRRYSRVMYKSGDA